MKTYRTTGTNQNQFDDLYFEANNYAEAFAKAEDVLTSYGYPEWCDENGYFSYCYEVQEVADDTEV